MSIVRFGDVVKDIKLNVDRSNNPYEHYIAGDHMDTEDLTLRRKGAFATDDVGPAFIRIFKPGQVLYGSRRTYLKKVAVADFEGVTANTTFVFETVDDDVLSQKLLPFLMLSEEFTKWSIMKSKGSTNPYVLFSDLADYEFELPSISQQRVLADKLWAAYNLKEAYKKMNSAIDEMVKSQFIEMFGNPNRNTKGFNQYAISDIFDLQMGKTPERGNQNYWNKGVNIWISISDMQDDCKYVGDGKEYITDLAVSESGIKIIPQGTLLMSFKLTIGRVAIADKDIYTNEAIMAFKDKCVVELSQQWLYNLLAQYDWLENASQAAKGKTLNKEIIGRSIVSIPPIKMQEEFATIVQQADKSKFELKQAIDKIEKVMKSLLQ